jgi:hypothetical protein
MDEHHDLVGRAAGAEIGGPGVALPAAVEVPGGRSGERYVEHPVGAVRVVDDRDRQTFRQAGQERREVVAAAVADHDDLVGGHICGRRVACLHLLPPVYVRTRTDMLGRA